MQLPMKWGKIVGQPTKVAGGNECRKRGVATAKRIEMQRSQTGKRVHE